MSYVVLDIYKILVDKYLHVKICLCVDKRNRRLLLLKLLILILIIVDCQN